MSGADGEAATPGEGRCRSRRCRECDSRHYRRPMKRLVPTPRGMAELDIAGSERHVFVTVTRFDEDGWATEEEMWASHHAESLPLLVSRLTEMPTAEADAVVENLMATWRVKGGPAEGATLTRRFGLGIVGVLLAVAVVAVLLFWAIVAVLN